MFGILEIGHGPAASGPLTARKRGWLRKAKPEPLDYSWDDALGARAMTVRLLFREDEPCEVRDAKLERVCRLFAEHSVRGVVVPKGFDRHGVLESYGLAAADPMVLLRRMAPRLVEAAGRPGQRIIGVMASRASPEVRETVWRAAGSARYLFLRCPGGGKELAAEIRRRTGLSVFESPSDMALASSETLVVFDPVPERGREGVVALPVRDGSTVVLLTRKLMGCRIRPQARVLYGAGLTPPARLMPVWPASCDAGALLMALYAQNAVTLEEIGIVL
jgi:hypothetical protein